jgi:hypothetical protein
MDIKSVLQRYDTKSTNTSNLMPSHVNRDANIKLLAKLEARNRANKANHQYHFKSMLDQLKGRSTMAMLDNPQAYAQVQDPTLTNQKAELVRMAKITANEARRNMGTYDEAREQFITNYSPKINQFRMLPEIQGIFQQFSDPNYSEKGYDKNYLGQGASDKYLESIMANRQSEQLKKSLEDLNATQATTTGAVQALLGPLGRLNTTMSYQKMIEDEKDTDKLSKEELKRLQQEKINRAVQARIDANNEQEEGKLDDAGILELQAQEEARIKAEEEANVIRDIDLLRSYNDEEFYANVLAIELPSKGKPFTTFEHFIKSAYNKVNSPAVTSVKAVQKLARDNRIEFPVKPTRGATAEQRKIYDGELNAVKRELTLIEAERRFRRLKK